MANTKTNSWYKSMQIKFYPLIVASLIHTPLWAVESNQFYEGDEFADFYAEDELISIATGTVIPIRKAPSVASVISRQQIDAMGATHLDEVLERIPGLHVMPSNLSRLDPVYSIRGIQTGFNPQILVLLNGNEIKHNYNGGLAFTFRMPLHNISRIEVIRGPGSAVYGADAFSGVINIITQTAEENANGSAGIRLGSFDSQDLWFSKGYVAQDHSVSFAFSQQTSDGDSGRIIESDLQSGLDTLFSTNSSEAPGALSTHYDTTNLQLDLSYGNWQLNNWYWKQDKAGIGQGGALALDQEGYQNSEQFLTHLNYSTELDTNLHFNADLSYLRTESDTLFNLFPAGSTLPIGSDGNAFSLPFSGNVVFTDGYIGNPQSVAETTKLELSALYNGIEEHSIRLASGWTYNKIDTQEYKNFGPGVIDGTATPIDGTLTNVSDSEHVFLPNSDREALFISAQDQWQISNDWSLTAGLRWDRYSDFGSTTTPRIALVWETSHDLTTKILYGTAFRAPSFSEQYLQNNPALLGNPDLEPEEITTWELAFDYRLNFDTRLKANFYTYEATDLIDTVVTGSTITYANARDQDGYGSELEADWQVSDKLHLNASYAYQNAEDAATGAAIPDVPTHSTYLDLNYSFTPEFNGSLQHYWIGSRERATGDSRDDIEDYHWVNVKLSRLFKQNKVTASLIVKNLFDTDAREPSSSSIPNDYPLEGRSIWGELKYQF